MLGLATGGVLAIVPTLVSGWEPMNAAHVACRREVQRLAKALDRYRADCGRYPDTLQGLVADYDVSGWRSPYVDKVRHDTWGRPFVYLPAAGSTAPEVLSYGLDGKPRGYRDNTDISSRHLNEPPPIAPFGIHSILLLIAFQSAAWLLFGACMLALGRTSRRMLGQFTRLPR